MADLDSSATNSDLGRGNDLYGNRPSREELEAIKAWSHDVERNQFAFGPTIDKQRAIKLLLAELAAVEPEREE